MKIVFVADDHYGCHAGRNVYEELKKGYEIDFYENDWSGLSEEKLNQDCDLLILNMIAGTCNLELPGDTAEKAVKAYFERGGNLLLLHGGSAAFWHWDWWRSIVGYRWVRGDDSDGFAPSAHPVKPYDVTVAKTRHPLAKKLKNMSLPEDEIYIELEQTCPATILMETKIEEGTFVQCYEAVSSWGGIIIGFLPGHRPEATTDPVFLKNIKILIEYFNK